jgi:hypothetical protein
MRTATLILLALLFLLPPTATAEPVPSPGVEVEILGCDPCREGHYALAGLKVANPGERREVWAGRIISPDAGVPPRWEAVTLEPGASVVFLELLQITGPAGAYVIEGVLLDPTNGATLARHVVGVTRE